jgi:hypothetical protein
MPRRILVRGASGAGKSTLGQALARHLTVPFVELDALHHGPNWTAASAEELRARVSVLLDEPRGSVVDGNYDSKLGTLVIDRADLIVWLDLPLRTELRRLAYRTLRRWLLSERLWNGNRQTLKGAFRGKDALIPWAIASHFRHRRLWPQKLAARPVVRLGSALEVESWFSDFCSHGSTFSD